MQIRRKNVLIAAVLMTLMACEMGTGPEPSELSPPGSTPPLATPTSPPTNSSRQGEVPFVWSLQDGVEEIPLPSGAIRGSAVAINSSGDVAGLYQPAGSIARAFVWSRVHGMRVLPPLGEQGQVSVIDINDRGEVLGVVSFAWSPSISFVWSAAAGFTMIGSAEADIVARGFNNRGEVVGVNIYQHGYQSAPSVAYEAFIWDQRRGFRKVSASGQYQLDAAAHINDAGEIVGFEADEQTDPMSVRAGGRLLRWASEISQPVALVPFVPAHGCDNWWANEIVAVGCADVRAINANGEAVGSLNGRAFRSSPGNAPVYLSPNEGRASFATGINEQGLVAGYTVSNPGFGAVVKAFVWHPDGSVTRPPNLPGRASTFVADINDNGQVVGTAR